MSTSGAAPTRRVFLALLGLAVSFSQPTSAAPQVNVGVLVGGGYDASPELNRGYLQLALRADVLFGRDGHHDVGLGPSLEVATRGWSDLRVLALPSLLLPLGDLQLVTSAGPLLIAAPVWGAGVAGRAFLGFRSYNHYANYSAAAGLVLGADVSFAGASSQLWHAAVQLDAMWLSLPFVALASWLTQ